MIRKRNFSITRQVPRNIICRLAKPWKHYSPESNHYIFADARGGSTWLSEVIQQITNEPILSEPFNPSKIKSPLKKIAPNWCNYVPVNEDWQELYTIFDGLFRGRIFHDSLLYRATFSQYFNSTSLLVKFCRANAVLPWLVNQFEFNYDPILLLRHPFAIASSKMRHPSWSKDKASLTIPGSLFNNIFTEHEGFLTSISTLEEISVARWCIYNLVALNSPKNNIKWITVNYEQLVLSPEMELQRILNRWSLDYDLDRIDFSVNSKSTKSGSPDDIRKRISHWQHSLSTQQIKKMGRVLDYFEIPWYSKDNAFPEVQFD